MEENSALLFFDVLILKDDLVLTDSFHRKPVKLDSVIPFNASLPFIYCIAACNSFIKRAFLVCSAVHLHNELGFK